MFDRYFDLSARHTTFSREVKAGIATFLTLSYILFVQPAVLSGRFFGIETGMDFGALLTGTCLAAAFGTFLMALYARLPISQAPGMGENFFFTTSLLPAAAAVGLVSGVNGWQIALGAVFFSSLIFLALSLLGVASRMVQALSPSMRDGLVVGIGLFITLIGLENSGLIEKSQASGLSLTSHFTTPATLVFFTGLFTGVALHARKVSSYILWAIIGSFLMATLLHFIVPAKMTFQLPTEIVSLPPSIAPLWFKLDLAHAFSIEMIPLILILLVLSLFDATGTLIAVTKEAGLVREEKIPRAKAALVSNSLAAMAGSFVGMSTITSFMESLAGVEQGGRTGVTSLTVGFLFLLSLFFYPLIAMVANYPPITAPALVLVGTIMLKRVKEIDWTDYTETLPSVLIAVCIPFFFSIANGIGMGLAAYPVVKILTGRFKDLNVFNIFLGLFFLLYFLFLVR